MERLTLPADFRRVYAQGKIVKHRLVVLHYLANGQGTTRVGFSVSKKLGNAVNRNRIKRRLREIMRKQSPLLKPGYDLVVSARIQCRNAAFREVKQAVDATLGNAQLVLNPAQETGEETP
ncbi:MAG: ribonuclease P protein component [Firmicutes bacterium]|nr:ribonuclease P protein component [Bacillota bacterium]